jgi:hypothetical protein
MRNPIDIREEIDGLADRRTELWKELSFGHDSVKAAEIQELSDSMDRLWNELRDSTLALRFGARDRIIARARADLRLESELVRRTELRRIAAERAVTADGRRRRAAGGAV